MLTACGGGSGSDARSIGESVGSLAQWIELGDGAGVEWEGGFVACGKWAYEAEGGTPVAPELYHFERLNQQLAGSAPLRDKVARVGINRVDSCAKARAVAQARTELQTGQSRSSVASGETTQPTPRPERADVDGRVDKIGSGFPHSYAPTVFMCIWSGNGYANSGMCSGTLIGPNLILTAAHCVVAENSRPMNVMAWNGTCLHGDCSGGAGNLCAVKPAKTGVTYPYPYYSGAGDWVEDVAVVAMYNNHPSPSNTSANWLRLVAEHFKEGERYWLSGWGVSGEAGFGLGTERLSKQDIVNESSSEPRMLVHETVHGQGTPCAGDSGGPAITTGYGFEAVAGVESGFVGSNAFCPQLGDPFHHAQTYPKIAWIESKVGACYRATSNGLNYARCWWGIW